MGVCIAKRSQVGLSILSTIFCMRIHQYAGVFLSHSSRGVSHGSGACQGTARNSCYDSELPPEKHL